MTILLNENDKIVVQGITGREGSFHAKLMHEYGANVVAGVSPGKEGQRVFDIPVYNSLKTAVEEKGATVSVVFVPAARAKGALIEAAESGIKLVVCITEGIPVLDVLSVKKLFVEKGVRLIGPNCPGIISPGKAKAGIMPTEIHQPGDVAVLSRSGTLTYEIVYQLTRNNLGQSTVIGVGGDTLIGSKFMDLIPLLEKDTNTKEIVLIGEIGGSDEVEVAHAKQRGEIKKPIYCFLSGWFAPKDKVMGHAGAIIGNENESINAKSKHLKMAGISIAHQFEEIPKLIYHNRKNLSL